MDRRRHPYSHDANVANDKDHTLTTQTDTQVNTDTRVIKRMSTVCPGLREEDEASLHCS